jgi:hypothetical protein
MRGTKDVALLMGHNVADDFVEEMNRKLSLELEAVSLIAFWQVEASREILSRPLAGV